MPGKKTDLLRAASSMTRARDLLREARLQMARSTVAGDPFHVVDPRWQWAVRLLNKRRAALLTIEGVIAAELGHRLKNGVLTQEPCITVYVHKKLAREEIKRSGRKSIPKSVRDGKRRLPIDVVALGKIQRQADAGDSIGPRDELRTGTLGAFAVDEASGRTVAITAMHVSGMQEVPSPPVPAFVFCQPSRQDAPGSAVFATLMQGSMLGIDAAKLDVMAQPPPVTTFPDGRVILGWRPTSFPGDRGAVVHMCGARSGLVSGFIVNPFLSIPSWDLDAAMLVNIDSTHGDSGAALIDSSNLLLGFLVGMAEELGNLRIFVPAGLVFGRLGCDMRTL